LPWWRRCDRSRSPGLGPDIVHLSGAGARREPAYPDQIVHSEGATFLYFNGKKVVAYFHGNGEDLADSIPMISLLRTLGVGVLAVEYPGYGIAGGTPSEQGAYEAAETALRWLRSEQGSIATGSCSSASRWERAWPPRWPGGVRAPADPHFAVHFGPRCSSAQDPVPAGEPGAAPLRQQGEGGGNRPAGLDHPRDGRRRGSVRHGRAPRQHVSARAARPDSRRATQ